MSTLSTEPSVKPATTAPLPGGGGRRRLVVTAIIVLVVAGAVAIAVTDPFAGPKPSISGSAGSGQ